MVRTCGDWGVAEGAFSSKFCVLQFWSASTWSREDILYCSRFQWKQQTIGNWQLGSSFLFGHTYFLRYVEDAYALETPYILLLAIQKTPNWCVHFPTIFSKSDFWPWSKLFKKRHQFRWVEPLPLCLDSLDIRTVASWCCTRVTWVKSENWPTWPSKMVKVDVSEPSPKGADSLAPANASGRWTRASWWY